MTWTDDPAPITFRVMDGVSEPGKPAEKRLIASFHGHAYECRPCVHPDLWKVANYMVENDGYTLSVLQFAELLRGAEWRVPVLEIVSNGKFYISGPLIVDVLTGARKTTYYVKSDESKTYHVRPGCYGAKTPVTSLAGRTKCFYCNISTRGPHVEPLKVGVAPTEEKQTSNVGTSGFVKAHVIGVSVKTGTIGPVIPLPPLGIGRPVTPPKTAASGLDDVASKTPESFSTSRLVGTPAKRLDLPADESDEVAQGWNDTALRTFRECIEVVVAPLFDDPALEITIRFANEAIAPFQPNTVLSLLKSVKINELIDRARKAAYLSDSDKSSLLALLEPLMKSPLESDILRAKFDAFPEFSPYNRAELTRYRQVVESAQICKPATIEKLCVLRGLFLELEENRRYPFNLKEYVTVNIEPGMISAQVVLHVRKTLHRQRTIRRFKELALSIDPKGESENAMEVIELQRIWEESLIRGDELAGEKANARLTPMPKSVPAPPTFAIDKPIFELGKRPAVATLWLQEQEVPFLEYLKNPASNNFKWFVQLCNDRWLRNFPTSPVGRFTAPAFAGTTRAVGSSGGPASTATQSETEEEDDTRSDDDRFSFDGKREFLGPRNVWMKVSDMTLDFVQGTFGFVFPKVYAAFLRYCHRPEYPESRLVLTNWHTDNTDSDSPSSSLMSMRDRGEPLSRRKRMDRAEIEIEEAVATFFGRTKDSPLWKEFPTSYRKRDLPSKFEAVDAVSQYFKEKIDQSGIAEELKRNRGKRSQPPAGMFRIPRLIPIANGVQHYYMFERGARYEGVVTFAVCEAQLCVKEVAPSLHHFLLRFFSAFSLQCQGFLGNQPFPGDYDDRCRPTALFLSPTIPLFKECVEPRVVDSKTNEISNQQISKSSSSAPRVPFWECFWATEPQLHAVSTSSELSAIAGSNKSFAPQGSASSGFDVKVDVKKSTN